MAPLDEVVPHEPEGAGPGAEQVEDEVLGERDAAEVHGDGRGPLGLHLGDVVHALRHVGDEGLGAKRVDLGDGTNEGGFTDAESARHDDFVEALERLEGA